MTMCLPVSSTAIDSSAWPPGAFSSSSSSPPHSGLLTQPSSPAASCAASPDAGWVLALMRATAAAARWPMADILSSRGWLPPAFAVPMIQSISTLERILDAFIELPPWQRAASTHELVRYEGGNLAPAGSERKADESDAPIVSESDRVFTQHFAFRDASRTRKSPADSRQRGFLSSSPS